MYGADNYSMNPLDCYKQQYNGIYQKELAFVADDGLIIAINSSAFFGKTDHTTKVLQNNYLIFHPTGTKLEESKRNV